MVNEKRIKLDQPVPIMDKFTYQCANCHAMLFASDNYCPCCGENVSNCLGVVILKAETEDKDG